VNDAIWKMYFDELLPLFTVDGDDGSYAETVALDFACLQVLFCRFYQEESILANMLLR